MAISRRSKGDLSVMAVLQEAAPVAAVLEAGRRTVRLPPR
jgi:hypothetical protein